MKRWAGVARFGSIGDNLIAASVLHPLKRMGYMTDVITSSMAHVVYLHNPNIDKLSIKRDGDLPKNLLEWQQWIKSRANEYDLFLHASHSCEGKHALFKEMTDYYLPPEYRRQRCKGSYLETVHDIMGVPHEFGKLFYSSEEEEENALRVKRQVGDRCIAWVVCGSRIDKVYPYATYAIARTIKEIGAPVVLMAGPSEKELAMVNHIKERVAVENGTRDGLHAAIPAGGVTPWPLRSSLAFVQACDLVISPDTGPAWAVAMEPTPKIIMVSHASAENITKHWLNTTTLHADPDNVPCWPCHLLHETMDTCVANKHNDGAACISDISVERLVSTIAEVWRNGKVIHAEHAFRKQGVS